jgi:hypothetical protein
MSSLLEEISQKARALTADERTHSRTRCWHRWKTKWIRTSRRRGRLK